MRLIDADALDEEVMHLFIAITGAPKQSTVVNECKKSFRKMIDEQPTIDVPDTNVGKQTNADRIRSMTDEELADFIETKQFFAIARNRTDGEEYTLQWLKSEVEDNEDD